MGMYPGVSVCRTAACVVRNPCPDCDPTPRKVRKARKARKVSLPNPDPNRFNIVDIYYNGKNTVVRVKYEGCTNYEGLKIMVYKGFLDTKDIKELDPHFCENHVSPIARFEPTEEGWGFAMEFADLV